MSGMTDRPAEDATGAGSGAAWSLYMIRCRGGFLYTGITTDVDRRFAEHQAGKGAKYLRGKGPLSLVFRQQVGTHSDALRLEAAIKKLSRADKEAMISRGIIRSSIV